MVAIRKTKLYTGPPQPKTKYLYDPHYFSGFTRPNFSQWKVAGALDLFHTAQGAGKIWRRQQHLHLSSGDLWINLTVCLVTSSVHQPTTGFGQCRALGSAAFLPYLYIKYVFSPQVPFPYRQATSTTHGLRVHTRIMHDSVEERRHNAGPSSFRSLPFP